MKDQRRSFTAERRHHGTPTDGDVVVDMRAEKVTESSARPSANLPDNGTPRLKERVENVFGFTTRSRMLQEEAVDPSDGRPRPRPRATRNRRQDAVLSPEM